MMLAQLNTPTPEPHAFLQFWIIVGFIAALVLTFVSIWAKTRKHNRTEISPQPFEVRKSPKRYNHEQTEQRYSEVSRRLDGHDAELEQLWQTMRTEDAAIREKNGERFEEIMRALGRIEGELKGK